MSSLQNLKQSQLGRVAINERELCGLAIKQATAVVLAECVASFPSTQHGRRFGQKVGIGKGLGYGNRNLFWS